MIIWQGWGGGERHAACGILVSQPVIELVPPAAVAQSLNHWTAREVPKIHNFNQMYKSLSSVKFKEFTYIIFLVL